MLVIMGSLESRFPVVELYGPVIEGEGFYAGAPTIFIRFGLCDFRCLWCDSMHAVDPAEVKANAQQLTIEEIVTNVEHLARGYKHQPMVTFSGGNPAIHQLGPLVESLQKQRFVVKVETQGSVWHPWLANVNHVIVSPKPPSAGTFFKPAQFDEFMRNLRRTKVGHSIKVVVFDDNDLRFARFISDKLPRKNGYFFLSCGTNKEDTRDTLGERYRWLCEESIKIFADSEMPFRVLPQLHVFAYLHLLGV